jgi:hypothetical protein
MKAEDRAKLLKLISDGHDPAAAVVALSLDVSVVNELEFQSAIQEALRVGTAMLRGKVLELAINNGNVRALEKQLERRETLAAGEDVITSIACTIVFNCEKCGYQPGFEPRKPKQSTQDADGLPKAIPGNGAAAT